MLAADWGSRASAQVPLLLLLLLVVVVEGGTRKGVQNRHQQQ
jgi:hypothetical protein